MRINTHTHTQYIYIYTTYIIHIFLYSLYIGNKSITDGDGDDSNAEATFENVPSGLLAPPPPPIKSFICRPSRPRHPPHSAETVPRICSGFRG